MIFPTANDDALGSGKYQLGPAAVLFRLAPEFGTGRLDSLNAGVVAQHWWSVGGDDDRADVSQTNIQYFLNYRLSPTKQVGMQPTIEIDWEADSDNRYSVPIGLGYSDTFRIGRIPLQWRVEAQYYVIRPDDFGQDFSLQFSIAPILPSLL